VRALRDQSAEQAEQGAGGFGQLAQCS
jgi:hypothetical protein